jgi:hypothetical protein
MLGLQPKIGKFDCQITRLTIRTFAPHSIVKPWRKPGSVCDSAPMETTRYAHTTVLVDHVLHEDHPGIDLEQTALAVQEAVAEQSLKGHVLIGQSEIGGAATLLTFEWAVSAPAEESPFEIAFDDPFS